MLLLSALAIYLAYAATASRPAHAATAAHVAIRHRVVSLAPALTEMLYALGEGPEVVGVSAYSDFPADARKKPVVGDALHVNEERVAALRPDVIVAAEGDAARLDRLAKLTGAHTQLLPTRHVADIWANMKALGKLTQHEPQAAARVAALQARLHRLARPAGARPIKVFYMVWDQPLMTAGRDSYLNDLIELAGGRNVAAAASGGSYPSFSWETLLAADPDVILAPTKLAKSLDSLSSRYPGLTAVKHRRVRTLPDDLISRPGPRVAEALAAVEAALR